MLSQKEVQHIAKLARLGLSSQEEKKFQKELSSILDYVAKLKKANVTGVKPTSHPFSLSNIKRADEGKKKTHNLLSLAPETKDNYVKVKSILK
ncbi:MAG: Asp-tRNA(Asn)/Glu-tRNA(Gln) amidotransferase subunit GatC [Candidatus Nealsonbacteria bacterium]